MIFFPALTLNKVSGLEIPSICCEWYFNLGLSFGRVVCIIDLYISICPGQAHTSHLLPKDLLSCPNKNPLFSGGFA